MQKLSKEHLVLIPVAAAVGIGAGQWLGAPTWILAACALICFLYAMYYLGETIVDATQVLIAFSRKIRQKRQSTKNERQ